MAVINIGIQTTPNTSVQSAPSATETTRQISGNRTVQEVEQAKERQLENVVSTSEDGDTVQVSESATNRVNEANAGAVTMRTGNNRNESIGQQQINDRNETANDARERMGMGQGQSDRVSQAQQMQQTQQTQQVQLQESSAQQTAGADRERAQMIAQANLDRATAEAEQNNQQQVTSLAGMTTQQLDTLYREGRISQQEYDTQMQRRQDQLEEASARSAEMSQLGSAAIRATNNNQLDNMAINITFSDQSSDTIDREVRYDAMQNIRQAQEGPAVQRQRNEERRLWDYQLQV